MRNAFNRTYTQFLWSMLAEEWTPPAVTPKTPFDAAKLKREIARTVEKQAAMTRERHQNALPFPFFLTDSTDPPEEK